MTRLLLLFLASGTAFGEWTTTASVTETLLLSDRSFSLPHADLSAGWRKEWGLLNAQLEARVHQDGALLLLNPGSSGLALSLPLGSLRAGWRAPRHQGLEVFELQDDFGVTPPQTMLSTAARAIPLSEFLTEAVFVQDWWTVALTWAPFQPPEAGIDTASPWFPTSAFPQQVSVPTKDGNYLNAITPDAAPSISGFTPGSSWKAETMINLPWFTWSSWVFEGWDRSLRYRPRIEFLVSPSLAYDGTVSSEPQRVLVVGTGVQGAWEDATWGAEARWVRGQTIVSSNYSRIPRWDIFGFEADLLRGDVIEAAGGGSWRWGASGVAVWAEARTWIPLGDWALSDVPDLTQAAAAGVRWSPPRTPWAAEVFGTVELQFGSVAVWSRWEHRDDTGGAWAVILPVYGGREGSPFGNYSRVRTLQLQWTWGLAE